MRRNLVVLGVLAMVAGLVAGAERADQPAPMPVAAETGSAFTPLTPVRVLDTRTGPGPVGAGRTIALNLSARVPAGATAVVLNLTGTAATAPTFVTAYPAGAPRPVASNLNLVARDTRPVLTTVALGANRGVTLYNHLGSVHLLADLAGYYAPGAGSKYTPLSATRVLDTRADPPPALGPGASQVVDLTGKVPSSATSVTLNLTGVGATAATFLTAWPTDRPRPTASNLNLNAGGTRPNLATVAIGADRRISLYNLAGTVDVLVDLTGFYTPEFGATFVPNAPVRVLDTRNSAGQLGPAQRLPVNLGAPANATAALLNVTGVAPTAATYVAVWAADGRPDGAVSTLNLVPGETAANLTSVALSTMSPVVAYNFRGGVHVVADLAGVFVTPTAGCTLDCAYTWGGNESWALGTGDRASSSASAAQVVGLSGVTALAGGRGAVRYALRADGTVLAWGQAPLGQLGGGWSAVGWSAVPAPVPGLTEVTSIAAGRYHAVAGRADGTVWAWGMNAEGGLGDGGPVRSDVPVRVSGLTGVTSVAAGEATSYALRADGTVLAWGSNLDGALGNASLAEYSQTPVQVAGLTEVTAIAGGNGGGYALRADGTVWAWGANWSGELGDGADCEPSGTGCRSVIPVQVTGLTGVTAIATSAGTTGYALRADGTVWAWGGNERGALGNGADCQDGTGCRSRVPVQVAGLTDVTGIAGGSGAGYALRADGTVSAWGENTNDELGDGTVCDDPAGCVSPVPVRVTGLTRAAAVTSGGALVPNP
ncbi:RCC1 domain-containing protein [Actinophytocola sediminis]